MPTPRKDQKKIAQQYTGNLRYFRQLHPFRWLRGFLVLFCAVSAMAVGAIYLLYWHVQPAPIAGTTVENPSRQITPRPFEWLNSPGGISQAHSQIAQDCDKCHDPEHKNTPLQASAIKASLDAKCEVCHNQPSFTFHQLNVVGGTSCTDCHQEHLGTGPMHPVTDNNCLSCHNNSTIMGQAALAGKDQPETMKPFHQDSNVMFFKPANKTLRPLGGYTMTFASFADGHPDFQIQREQLTDPNTLKFDHKFHFSDQVRTADGKQLSCETCHKLDSRGAYTQAITFAKNCQECHAIKIDPTLADFIVPHPNGPGGDNSVRSFLKTLPVQYASYAEQVKGITQTDKINAFVGQHMKLIQNRVRSGEKLEAQVFYSNGKTVSYGPGTANASERALFPGCAECHEVKRSLTGEPSVVPPVTPDRWYVHAKFNHAAHTAVRSCEECHSMARQSDKTSDILLPDKASCVTCHSPKGGVVSTCVTCHDFHNQSPAHEAAAAVSPLKNMMLAAPAQ